MPSCKQSVNGTPRHALEMRTAALSGRNYQGVLRILQQDPGCIFRLGAGGLTMTHNEEGGTVFLWHRPQAHTRAHTLSAIARTLLHILASAPAHAHGNPCLSADRTSDERHVPPDMYHCALSLVCPLSLEHVCVHWCVCLVESKSILMSISMSTSIFPFLPLVNRKVSPSDSASGAQSDSGVQSTWEKAELARCTLKGSLGTVGQDTKTS